jgi:hypothetical protein
MLQHNTFTRCKSETNFRIARGHYVYRVLDVMLAEEYVRVTTSMMSSQSDPLYLDVLNYGTGMRYVKRWWWCHLHAKYYIFQNMIICYMQEEKTQSFVSLQAAWILFYCCINDLLTGHTEQFPCLQKWCKSYAWSKIFFRWRGTSINLVSLCDWFIIICHHSNALQLPKHFQSSSCFQLFKKLPDIIEPTSHNSSVITGPYSDYFSICIFLIHQYRFQSC